MSRQKLFTRRLRPVFLPVAACKHFIMPGRGCEEEQQFVCCIVQYRYRRKKISTFVRPLSYMQKIVGRARWDAAASGILGAIRKRLLGNNKPLNGSNH